MNEQEQKVMHRALERSVKFVALVALALFLTQSARADDYWIINPANPASPVSQMNPIWQSDTYKKPNPSHRVPDPKEVARNSAASETPHGSLSQKSDCRPAVAIVLAALVFAVMCVITISA